MKCSAQVTVSAWSPCTGSPTSLSISSRFRLANQATLTNLRWDVELRGFPRQLRVENVGWCSDMVRRRKEGRKAGRTEGRMEERKYE